jgi:hypothetical protein
MILRMMRFTDLDLAEGLLRSGSSGALLRIKGWSDTRRNRNWTARRPRPTGHIARSISTPSGELNVLAARSEVYLLARSMTRLSAPCGRSDSWVCGIRWRPMVFRSMSGPVASANGYGLSSFRAGSSMAKSSEHVMLCVLTMNARRFNRSCGMNHVSLTLRPMPGQPKARGLARFGFRVFIPMLVADIQTILWPSPAYLDHA